MALMLRGLNGARWSSMVARLMSNSPAGMAAYQQAANVQRPVPGILRRRQVYPICTRARRRDCVHRTSSMLTGAGHVELGLPPMNMAARLQGAISSVRASSVEH